MTSWNTEIIVTKRSYKILAGQVPTDILVRMPKNVFDILIVHGQHRIALEIIFVAHYMR